MAVLLKHLKNGADMINYKDSGVDIEAGDALVDWLKANQSEKRPFEDQLVSGIGGFAAIMKFPFMNMKEPCLVSATDGIGTKLKLAIAKDDYSSIGQDLVAMCVNDLVCCGAQPLFFLDYYATGKLELDTAKEFLGGVQRACNDSGCLLIGGETAEMPGVYSEKDFDCAGFAVGVVDREKILGRHLVKEGDVILGVSSSGCHSNGYSLLRKLFKEDLEEYLGQLIAPTHLYPSLVGKLKEKLELHALAHITGGGIDNLVRVLAENLSAEVKQWSFSDLFLEIQKRSGLSDQELMKTFNCGIGLMIILPESEATQAVALIKEQGFEAYRLGHVVSGDGSLKVH